MDQSQLKDLIARVNKGTASEEELAAYNAYMNRMAPGHTGWDAAGMGEPELIRQELWGNIREGMQAEQPVRKIRLWPRIAAAASILLCLSIGLYFYQHKTNPETSQLAKNDVAPGKSNATLTLANGHKILLSAAIKGEFAKEAGVSITKTTDGKIVYQVKDKNTAEPGQFNMLATARGETYQVDLPDGSKVWLNAASSLKYPASFAALAERKVELSGEAYFEVAKDKAHPFRVITDKQEVTVLGTHFNINAYADEAAVKTTLLEGSVKVAANSGNTVRIKPGEQAILKSNDFNITDADMESVMAWKNGDFIFKGEGLETAMLRVARWYNVEVVYDASAPKSLELGGWVSRNKNISTVLKMMESTGKVHFKVEGRRILVTK